jgi:hypothetical protein
MGGPQSIQQYIMVSFNLDQFEINIPHYIRNGLKRKMLGQVKPASGGAMGTWVKSFQFFELYESHALASSLG